MNISHCKVLTLALAISATSVSYAQEHQTKRLTIPGDKTSVSATGRITGYNDIDYLIHGKEGQTITVTLKSSRTSTYFMVFTPEDQQTAAYNSDMGSQTWTKTVDKTGDYKIRVYQMRNAARNNVMSSFTITVSEKTGATAKAGDAKVAGTKFNATGEIQAALIPTASLGSSMAKFGVVRYANGSADIHITNANNAKRIIKFSQGEFECLTPAGGKLTYTREGVDNWKVTFNGKETYLIPDAVIQGG